MIPVLYQIPLEIVGERDSTIVGDLMKRGRCYQVPDDDEQLRSSIRGATLTVQWVNWHIEKEVFLVVLETITVEDAGDQNAVVQAAKSAGWDFVAKPVDAAG